MSNTLGHKHHVLVSPRLGQNTHSQRIKSFLLTTMLLAQVDVRYNESSKDANEYSQSHTHEFGFLFPLKAHTIPIVKTDIFQTCSFFLSELTKFSSMKNRSCRNKVSPFLK